MSNSANSVEKIKIWKVHGDGGERGLGPVIAFCSTETKAKETVKGEGFFGSDGIVTEATALLVNGEVWLLARECPIDLDSVKATRDAELREKTLASLTDEQKRVLGLI